MVAGRAGGAMRERERGTGEEEEEENVLENFEGVPDRGARDIAKGSVKKAGYYAAGEAPGKGRGPWKCLERRGT
eukprot:3145413-Rhodomonas_salina.3